VKYKKLHSQKLRREWWGPETGESREDGGIGKGLLMGTKLQFDKVRGSEAIV
jgi:hypothetical protein